MTECRRAPGARQPRALAQLAMGYLIRRRLGERACRFDVVEVWVEPAGTLRVEVLRDAFRP